MWLKWHALNAISFVWEGPLKNICFNSAISSGVCISKQGLSKLKLKIVSKVHIVMTMRDFWPCVFLNVLSKYQSQCNRYYFYAQRPDEGEVRHGADRGELSSLIVCKVRTFIIWYRIPTNTKYKNESNILKQTPSQTVLFSFIEAHTANFPKSPIKSKRKTYDMSPYPTVVMVTTAHQKPSGMDLKLDWGEPASAKYTVLEKRTTPNKQ